MSSGGLFWTSFDSPISLDRSETKESLLREPSDSIIDDAIVAHRRCFFLFAERDESFGFENVAKSCVVEGFFLRFWVECYMSCNDVCVSS